jgi:hypothetical protein
MGAPTPPLDLSASCSAIYNNTLFVFSQAGFQSLSLTQGAQWQVLSPGVSVQGGVCVNALSQNDSASALYIVGGAANSSQSNFPGFQKYTYSTQKWDIIVPQVPVSQNRQKHGAAYLNQSSSIVVYAGSQDPSNQNPSSQTFLLSTIPPYTVLSFTSIAPPLTHPMVMPFNDTHAVMVGGDDDNKAVWVFGPNGWSNLRTSLPEAITNDMTMQCTITTGDDGSKVLEKYDLGVSPNTVTQYLLSANGQVSPVAIVLGNGGGNPGSPKQKRGATANNWPVYNASGAPTTPRSGYSIAQDSNGLAVIAGGGPANDPVQIFQEKQNDWVNVNTIFGSQAPLAPSSSSTPSPKPSQTTGAPTATTTVSTSEPKSKAVKILGGALGGVIGFAALLVIILLLIRCMRDRKQRKEEARRAATEKENRLSFADQGADFMRDAQGARKDQNTHSMVGSISSLQIFSGKAITGHRRGQPSDSSQIGLVQHKSAIGGTTDDLEMARVNNDRLSPPSTANTRVNSPYDAEGGALAGPLDRSTGWSQYFNNNQPVTNLAAPSAGNTGGRNSQTFLHPTSVRSSDLSGSDYDDAPPPGLALSGMRPLDVNLGPRFGAPQPTQQQQYALGRAISTSSYDQSHWSVLSEDRESHNSSLLTAFPAYNTGPGPAGNAFARPDNPLTSPNRPVSPLNSGVAAPGTNPTARDFPMPRAYFPPNPAPPPSGGLPAFPRSGDRRRDVESPLPKPEPRGPVIRKMTGNEDMSWLNINAAPGRPS